MSLQLHMPGGPPLTSSFLIQRMVSGDMQARCCQGGVTTFCGFRSMCKGKEMWCSL